ncbi:MAG: aldo/keto reductase [FCB group bacterium]|nr:aldo/keto reductase [FCB group bacterium]MBL7027258.1 aldo/keto reductase [Candidatus Neomarinimicrobiota bacterium]MBL7122228.1 aldo/keto reductase [Candidatus Neomarinimicrobiota bacterium]
MNPKNMKRRDFLHTGLKLATGAMFMGSGASSLLGAPLFGESKQTIETVTLNNNVEMPILGFGTNTLNGSIGQRCVAEAISLGYGLIDTAKIYGNEESVGRGIKQSAANRETLFVTSKLWVSDAGHENTMKAFHVSLKKLDLDYLDLYLIHRPRGDFKGSWKAMEALYKEGKIRAIGVSNFDPSQLKKLIASSDIIPAVNQIETHAFFTQNKQYDFLSGMGVQHEAWSPLAEGRNGIFRNEALATIGKKYNKNNAQVSLRWHYQRGIVAIPRTSQKAHMIENLNIFDFQLDDADMQTIAGLDLNKTQFPEWK